MNWTRSDTLALASSSCAYCKGIGLRDLMTGKTRPCECVFRGIFRSCLNKFIECAQKEKWLSQVTFDLRAGRNRRGTWGRKDEEYMADFMAIAKRVLDDEEMKVLRFHFLLGADWRLCVRKLGIDKGRFFHLVYRIEKKMGRECREVSPYALYPTDAYFNALPRQQLISPSDPPAEKPRVVPIRPPLAARPQSPERKAA